jgi:alpha-amylase
VTDYQAIDPAYGTMADFAALALDCREMGISLILDLVINHSSSQHPWFLAACQSLKDGTDSPYKDYYLFSRSAGHPVPEMPGWFYQGSFGPHMPDLNLDSLLVREEIKAILAFWLQAGADGFRLDGTTHYFEDNMSRNVAFLSWLRLEAKAIKPDVYIVAEAWKPEGTILGMYQSGIDSFFNFAFSGATGILVEAMRNQKGQSLADKIAGWQAQVKQVNPQALDAPFLSNHDMGRSSGYLMYNQQKMKLAAAVYLTMPGIPYIYYGEEIGMSGSGLDENKRLPMMWSKNELLNCLPPQNADQAQRLKTGVDEQDQDPLSLLNFYGGILAIRRAHPLLKDAMVEAVDLGNMALAAWRCTGEDESLLVIHNLSEKQVIVPVLQGEISAAWDTGSGTTAIISESLVLPPFSGCIMR